MDAENRPLALNNKPPPTYASRLAKQRALGGKAQDVSRPGRGTRSPAKSGRSGPAAASRAGLAGGEARGKADGNHIDEGSGERGPALDTLAHQLAAEVEACNARLARLRGSVRSSAAAALAEAAVRVSREAAGPESSRRGGEGLGDTGRWPGAAQHANGETGEPGDSGKRPGVAQRARVGGRSASVPVPGAGAQPPSPVPYTLVERVVVASGHGCADAIVGLAGAEPDQSRASDQVPRPGGAGQACWVTRAHRASEPVSSCTLRLRHPESRNVVIRATFAPEGRRSGGGGPEGGRGASSGGGTSPSPANVPKLLRLSTARSAAAAFEPAGDVALDQAAGRRSKHLFRLHPDSVLSRYLRLEFIGGHAGLAGGPGTVSSHRISSLAVTGDDASANRERGTAAAAVPSRGFREGVGSGGESPPASLVGGTASAARAASPPDPPRPSSTESGGPFARPDGPEGASALAAPPLAAFLPAASVDLPPSEDESSGVATAPAAIQAPGRSTSSAGASPGLDLDAWRSASSRPWASREVAVDPARARPEALAEPPRAVASHAHPLHFEGRERASPEAPKATPAAEAAALGPGRDEGGRARSRPPPIVVDGHEADGAPTAGSSPLSDADGSLSSCPLSSAPESGAPSPSLSASAANPRPGRGLTQRMPRGVERPGGGSTPSGVDVRRAAAQAGLVGSEEAADGASDSCRLGRGADGSPRDANGPGWAAGDEGTPAGWLPGARADTQDLDPTPFTTDVPPRMPSVPSPPTYGRGRGISPPGRLRTPEPSPGARSVSPSGAAAPHGGEARGATASPSPSPTPASLASLRHEFHARAAPVEEGVRLLRFAAAEASGSRGLRQLLAEAARQAEAAGLEVAPGGAVLLAAGGAAWPLTELARLADVPVARRRGGTTTALRAAARAALRARGGAPLRSTLPYVTRAARIDLQALADALDALDTVRARAEAAVSLASPGARCEGAAARAEVRAGLEGLRRGLELVRREAVELAAELGADVRLASADPPRLFATIDAAARLTDAQARGVEPAPGQASPQLAVGRRPAAWRAGGVDPSGPWAAPLGPTRQTPAFSSVRVSAPRAASGGPAGAVAARRGATPVATPLSTTPRGGPSPAGPAVSVSSFVSGGTEALSSPVRDLLAESRRIISQLRERDRGRARGGERRSGRATPREAADAAAPDKGAGAEVLRDVEKGAETPRNADAVGDTAAAAAATAVATTAPARPSRASMAGPARAIGIEARFAEPGGRWQEQPQEADGAFGRGSRFVSARSTMVEVAAEERRGAASRDNTGEGLFSALRASRASSVGEQDAEGAGRSAPRAGSDEPVSFLALTPVKVHDSASIEAGTAQREGDRDRAPPAESPPAESALAGSALAGPLPPVRPDSGAAAQPPPPEGQAGPAARGGVAAAPAASESASLRERAASQLVAGLDVAKVTGLLAAGDALKARIRASRDGIGGPERESALGGDVGLETDARLQPRGSAEVRFGSAEGRSDGRGSADGSSGSGGGGRRGGGPSESSGELELDAAARHSHARHPETETARAPAGIDGDPRGSAREGGEGALEPALAPEGPESPRSEGSLRRAALARAVVARGASLSVPRWVRRGTGAAGPLALAPSTRRGFDAELADILEDAGNSPSGPLGRGLRDPSRGGSFDVELPEGLRGVTPALRDRRRPLRLLEPLAPAPLGMGVATSDTLSEMFQEEGWEDEDGAVVGWRRGDVLRLCPGRAEGSEEPLAGRSVSLRRESRAWAREAPEGEPWGSDVDGREAAPAGGRGARVSGAGGGGLYEEGVGGGGLYEEGSARGHGRGEAGTFEYEYGEGEMQDVAL